MVLAFAAIMGATPAPPAAVAQSTTARADDAGSLGIRIMDVPTRRVKDPRALAYIVDSLKPGTTIQRRVEVHNSSTSPQHVELYAGAATIEHNTFTAGAGRTANELSSWVSVDSTAVDMKANAKKAIMVTIAVPRTAAAGEQYAAVWAQISKPPTENDNVGQVNRVGVRIYLNVGPGGEPRTDFRVDGITVRRAAGQWPVVSAIVHNTGGRAIDMGGTLTLSNGDGGINAGPFRVTTGVTIPPGGSGPITAILDKPLPAGDWDIKLSLISGTLEHTTSAKIKIPGPINPKPVQPWWRGRMAVAGSLAVVFGLAAVLLARQFLLYRRRRPRPLT